MKKLLLSLIGVLIALPALSQNESHTFDYTYEGCTVQYTVLDEETKTVAASKVISGLYVEWGMGDYGPKVVDSESHSHLILPEHPMDGNIQYTLVELGSKAYYAESTPDGAGYNEYWIEYAMFYFQHHISVSIPPTIKVIADDFSWFERRTGEQTEHGWVYEYSSVGFARLEISDLDAWFAMDGQSCANNLYLNGERVNFTGDYTIPETVTKIGSNKFSGCTGLTKAEFSSIEHLCSIEFGNYASNPLYYAKHLYINGEEITDLVIPESVTKIGCYAFYGCSGLTSVTIPNSVTEICQSTFSGCSGMTSVTIPNSVTRIGDCAFYGCTGLTSVTIPNSVTEICQSTFSGCSGMTSVTIPNSVTRIGGSAFKDCSSLTSITIGNSVTEIGYDAFEGCQRLTKAEFGSIENLCSIYFGNEESNPLCYAKHLYINGEEVMDVVIPNSVTSIGSYAFDGCSGLTSVTIPNSVTSIGGRAFDGCSSLTKAEFGSIENLCSINFGGSSSNPLYYAKHLYINGEEITDLVIPESVTKIGCNAFSGCTGITSVIIPNSVTEIDSYAFYGCTGLTSVAIPPSVTKLGFMWNNSDVFVGCYSIIKAAYPNTFQNPFSSSSGEIICYDAKETSILPESGALYNEDTKTVLFVPIPATSITIPEDTKIIGESAFLGCDSLKAITALPYVAPPTILSNNFTDSVYEHCRLIIPDGTYARYMNSEWKNFKNVEVAKPEGDDIKYFDGVFSYSYSPSTKEATLIQGEYSELTTAQIPNRIAVETEDETVFYSVTGIDDGAFMNCSNLTSVKLPKNLTRIGGSAFQECTGLTTIDLPEGVTEIGSHAFKNCSGLTSIVLPEGLTEISERVFYGCSNLASVNIPNSVTEIGSAAFCLCRSLTSVTIPNSVTKLGDEAFSDCTGLTSVTIPNSVTEIGAAAFADCTGLTSVNIQDGDLPLDISSVHLDYVKTMHLGRQWSAGLRLPATLETVSVGNTVSEIPDSTFINCQNLSSLTLGGTVEAIGKDAFKGCALQEVVIPPSVKSIGSNAFDGNSSLAEIKIGHGIEEIGEKAFNNCNTIANIYMTADIPPTAQNNTFSYYSSPLWLNDEDAFERYYNYPRCWYRFEDNMFTMKKVEALTADETDISGEPGDTIKITVTVEPADATLPNIFWASSDPSVATVDSDGNITFTAESAPTASSDEPEAGMIYDTVKSCVVTARSMYADVPLVEVTLNKTISDKPVKPEPDSIQTISANEYATTAIYNLRGVKVGESTDGLPKGIYIIHEGGKSRKIAL